MVNGRPFRLFRQPLGSGAGLAYNHPMSNFDNDPQAWRGLAAPSLADIEALAADAYARLPERFRALCEGLIIRVDDFPTEEVLETMQAETEFDLLGLFQGVGLPFQPASEVTDSRMAATQIRLVTEHDFISHVERCATRATAEHGRGRNPRYSVAPPRCRGRLRRKSLCLRAKTDADCDVQSLDGIAERSGAARRAKSLPVWRKD